jgi:hypothetical protein
MKNNWMILLAFVSLYSCADKGNNTSADNKPPALTVDTLSADTIVDGNKWSGTAGKKLSEVEFLTNPVIKKRLMALMGQEFDLMVQDWTQEEGIIVSENILMASGCSKSNCAGNHYIVLYDMIYNNLNVINFKQNRIRSYEENGVIGMPAKVQEAFDGIYASQMGK